MKRITMSGLAVAILVLIPGSTQAQMDEAFRDPGFWVQAGGGFASFKSDCIGCRESRTGSAHAAFGIGGSVSPRFRIGAEGIWAYRASGDTSVEMQAAFAVAEVVPLDGLPVSVQVGLGGARYAQLVTVDLSSSFGVGGTGAIKGEFNLGRGFHVAPYIRYVLAPNLVTKFNGLPQLIEATVNGVYLGLVVGWR